MKRFLVLNISFFLFLSLNAAIAINGIDIFYEETGDHVKNFRIVNYNISDHQFESIHYIKGNEVAEQVAQAVTAYKITIDNNGNVTLNTEFNSNDYLVRSNVSIQFGEGFAIPQVEERDTHHLVDIKTKGSPYDIRYSHVYRTRDIERAESIVKKFKKAKKKKIAADFPITQFPGQDGVVYTLAGLSKDKLGDLGEIATELTMLSFGYDQFASKYETNHGLDGVFSDRSPEPEYFVTESKCWGQSYTAERIMRNNLSEDLIYTRIKKCLEKPEGMCVSEKDSMTRLDKAIMDEEPIFKVTYRVLLNGSAQVATESLSLDKYLMASDRVTVDSVLSRMKKLSVTDREVLLQRANDPSTFQ